MPGNYMKAARKLCRCRASDRGPSTRGGGLLGSASGPLPLDQCLAGPRPTCLSLPRYAWPLHAWACQCMHGPAWACLPRAWPAWVWPACLPAKNPPAAHLTNSPQLLIINSHGIRPWEANASMGLHGPAWACMGMPRHANQYAWVCLSAMGMSISILK
jgi:hypothetical protein